MMFGRKKLYSSVLTAGLVLAGIGSAAAIETQARNAILMDYDTGQYLYVKDHEKMVPPASMSKLMTVNMIFEKLKDGSLSLDDTFTVSERAWKLGGAASGGSTMFLKIGEKVRVEDILKGILIQSGNDACIVAAENLAGSEDDFAEMMNKRARELGLNNSSFANSTGLPHPDQKMSVEDLAKLRDAANPMTLSQGLQELSVLCVMVSLFCVGMGLKKRTDTGAEAGNRKPEAKETAEPAAGEAAAEEPAAGPQEVPAAEDTE